MELPSNCSPIAYFEYWQSISIVYRKLTNFLYLFLSVNKNKKICVRQSKGMHRKDASL